MHVSVFNPASPQASGLLWLWNVRLIFNRGQSAPSHRPWAVVLWYEGERAPWSPDFGAKPLSLAVVHSASSDILHGADLFHTKGCGYCHAIAGNGGHRGPDLTSVAGRLTDQQITLRILHGADNMRAFASTLKPQELTAIVAFLNSRNPAAQANNQEE
jgi:ubiquinol-cytochrome c reductase cytochrome b subunit